MHLRVFAPHSSAVHASFAFIAALAGCDSNPAQPASTCTLTPTSMTVGAAGGTSTV